MNSPILLWCSKCILFYFFLPFLLVIPLHLPRDESVVWRRVRGVKYSTRISSRRLPCAAKSEHRINIAATARRFWGRFVIVPSCHFGTKARFPQHFSCFTVNVGWHRRASSPLPSPPVKVAYSHKFVLFSSLIFSINLFRSWHGANGTCLCGRIAVSISYYSFSTMPSGCNMCLDYPFPPSPAPHQQAYTAFDKVGCSG